MDTFIEFKNVSFYSEEYQVLKNISVKIPRHKCTVILGPSGCGKSTFLKLAAGIYPPDQGKVLVNDTDLYNAHYKKIKEFRKITGFVFEDSALWANASVFQNLALPLEFHFKGIAKSVVKDKVYKLLEKCSFVEEAHLRPDTFSTGEKKVVAFFRGIITEPEHLLMDNPLQSVDHEMEMVIIDTLKQMRAAQKTLILVTNEADFVSQMADYLIILKNGEVVEEGEFKIVLNSLNQNTRQILKQIIEKSASFDTDILDLLDTEQT